MPHPLLILACAASVMCRHVRLPANAANIGIITYAPTAHAVASACIMGQPAVKKMPALFVTALHDADFTYMGPTQVCSCGQPCN